MSESKDFAVAALSLLAFVGVIIGSINISLLISFMIDKIRRRRDRF